MIMNHMIIESIYRSSSEIGTSKTCKYEIDKKDLKLLSNKIQIMQSLNIMDHWVRFSYWAVDNADNYSDALQDVMISHESHSLVYRQ